MLVFAVLPDGRRYSFSGQWRPWDCAGLVARQFDGPPIGARRVPVPALLTQAQTAFRALSHPAVMGPRSRIVIRRRCRGVDGASLAASCNISTPMRGLLALVCRQNWCCEAHGCNCSAKNQPCDFCHDFRPREWANKTIFCYLRHAGDWVTLPQIPSRFLEVLWGCVRSFGLRVWYIKQNSDRSRPRRRVNRAD